MVNEETEEATPLTIELDGGDVPREKITIQANKRGFRYGRFVDKYQQSCSIQESSASSEECIWLGVDNTGPMMGNENVNGRMHLTQEMAAELIPLLQHFVDEGGLP